MLGLTRSPFQLRLSLSFRRSLGLPRKRCKLHVSELWADPGFGEEFFSLFSCHAPVNTQTFVIALSRQIFLRSLHSRGLHLPPPSKIDLPSVGECRPELSWPRHFESSLLKVLYRPRELALPLVIC